MQAINFFPRVGDAPDELLRKTSRWLLSRVGAYGTQTVEGAAGDVTVVPSDNLTLNVEAWSLIRNNSAVTVEGSVQQTHPVTLAPATVSFSLAPGQTLEGYFTSVTITGSKTPGSLALTILARSEIPRSTIALVAASRATAVHNGPNDHYVVTVKVRPTGGGFPPGQVRHWLRIAGEGHEFGSPSDADLTPVAASSCGEQVFFFPVTVQHGTHREYVVKVAALFEDGATGPTSEISFGV